jgi:molybdate transport system regulatory protein
MSEAREPALHHLRLGGASRAGEDRLGLLEAVGREGSITAAAHAVGLSYRAAWDAVRALNNLFPRPLVAARAGGAAGGSATLTAEGETALQTLRHVEGELALTLARLGRSLGGESDSPLPLDAWSLVMRTSARNALRGVVTAITHDVVESEVTLEISPGVALTAVISRRSVEALGLAVGTEATALVKASFVILAAGPGPWRTSARNALAGTVIAVEDGAVNSEAVLEIADRKTLTATITRHSAEALDLKVGDPATALIKASHVILAVG